MHAEFQQDTLHMRACSCVAHTEPGCHPFGGITVNETLKNLLFTTGEEVGIWTRWASNDRAHIRSAFDQSHQLCRGRRLRDNRDRTSGHCRLALRRIRGPGDHHNIGALGHLSDGTQGCGSVLFSIKEQIRHADIGMVKCNQFPNLFRMRRRGHDIVTMRDE